MKDKMGNESALRQHRGAIINLECAVCDRRTDLDRKMVVRQYEASLSFRQLRRRLVVRCFRMNSLDGIDRYQAHFPCLVPETNVSDD